MFPRPICTVKHGSAAMNQAGPVAGTIRDLHGVCARRGVFAPPQRCRGYFCASGIGLGGRDTFPRIASSIEMLYTSSVSLVARSSATFALL